MKFNITFADYTPELAEVKLAPVIVQDADTLEVLMFAWADFEALKLTHKTGFATFYSRSRNEIWVKGATSGNYLRIVKVLEDCDSDALLYLVEPKGPACHTGERTCFFRTIDEEGLSEKGVDNAC
ncbi:MAG: phosphoribosyl-AMP cyclohydrolase [Candidatus Ancillula sp.]|jgi:phosphoribosyl-AMP cyclohydrolase|nr:phosphoribosyl-AMP cyclohydrolase [Candidatus Ancillula sp.]